MVHQLCNLHIVTMILMGHDILMFRHQLSVGKVPTDPAALGLGGAPNSVEMGCQPRCHWYTWSSFVGCHSNII